MNKNIIKISTLLATSLWASQLLAGTVTIPNTFVSGAAASASEVNANFGAVKTSVDDNDSRITSNANDTSINAANIISNTNTINAIGGIGVLVNGVKIGSLLGFPGSASPSFNVLLTSHYLMRFELDGSGVSHDAPINTAFESSDCTGQSYAPVLGGGSIPVFDAFVSSGQGQLYGTTGGDPVLYRYVPSGTMSESVTYNSMYHYAMSGCQALSGTVDVYRTYPNNSNVTGVAGSNLVGPVTISH